MKYMWILLFLFLLLLPIPSQKEESEKQVQDFKVQKLSTEIQKRVTAYGCEEVCKEKIESLRYITLLYVDFEGKTQKGEMVAHEEIADDLKEIFEALYKAKYPLERVELIDVYKGSDEASMQDNNTSAFNFRYIAGTNRISKHAEGVAIDINPLYNPQVMESGKVYPEEGRAYADRSIIKPHMIDHEDLAYKLFLEHGFTWGGDWNRNKDYQHFEKEI